jgi:hypothetical protein
MAQHAIAVFSGASVNQLRTDLELYSGPDAIVRLYKDGDSYLLQVCDADGSGGDPINESRPCPGSPGCP